MNAATYSNQFPDFTLDVEIPAGFNDISYRNDCCPSWYHEGAQTLLYIDYANPEDRELPRPRFTLCQQDFDTDIQPHSYFEGDDWQEVQKHIRLRIATAIAKAFGRRLLEAIGADKVLQAVERNRKAEPGVCASHDFCDANMVMFDAMAEVLGRDPAISDEEPGADDDRRLWGEAWDIAHKSDLFFSVDAPFRGFQASRKETEDLSELCDHGTWEAGKPAPGFAYLEGALYIERVGADWPEQARKQGKYHLIIGNQEWITDDLEALERRLFNFAVSEGYAIPTAH